MAEPDSTSPPAAAPAPGLVGFVERAGNRLPHPFWLFVLFFAAWLGQLAGWYAAGWPLGPGVPIRSSGL